MGELLRNARFGFLQSLAKTIRGAWFASSVALTKTIGRIIAIILP